MVQSSTVAVEISKGIFATCHSGEGLGPVTRPDSDDLDIIHCVRRRIPILR